MQLIIWVDQISARMEYVLAEIFEHRLGIPYEIRNIELYEALNHAQIFYTKNKPETGLWVSPTGLLNGTYLEEYWPDVKKDENWHTILCSSLHKQVIPFDIFSAAFYLLTRYEEYFKYETDTHGRFKAEYSLAYKHHFIKIPLVDVWCEKLLEVLQNHFPTITSNAPGQFTKLSTIDIDFAYQYFGLSPKRWVIKLISAVLKFDIKAIIGQLFSSINKSFDPYNAYEYIKKNTSSGLAYFFLMSNQGGYDKNINPNSKTVKRLITLLSKQSQFIGLHPSYASGTMPQLLQQECNLLKQHVLQEINHSRQHFVLVNFPFTFQWLHNINIKHDYSLFYPDHIGFRASTCKPIRFFNVVTNLKTSLVLHSSCIMDVTLWNYQKLNTQQAKLEIANLIKACEKYQGEFISVWHNNTFANKNKGINLKEIYQYMHHNH